MNHTTRNGLLTHCFVWPLDFFAAILEATENGPKSFQQANTNKRSSGNLSKHFSDNLSGIFCLFVPTPLEGGGEELYTQLGFFLFNQFWPIDIFIVES